MAGPRLAPHLLGASRFFQGGRRRLLAELGVRFQRPVPLLGEEGDLPISVGPQVVSAAHRTLPLEDDTLVDDEARGRDVAEELARGTDFESLARRDVARHATVHHDGAPRDLRIDLGTLTDDQRILSRDLTLDVTLDAHRSLERELAGYPASLAEECAGAADVAGRAALSLALDHLDLRRRSRSDRRRHEAVGRDASRPLNPVAILSE